VNWNAHEIKQLRYRLGWSRAEMARSLNVQLATLNEWEAGAQLPKEDHRHLLLRILHQAESNAERVQRRPLAEVIMRERGWSQIHDLDVLDGIDETIVQPGNPPKKSGNA
jgi:transcriptional regulator with XRE-family HTH domain